MVGTATFVPKWLVLAGALLIGVYFVALLVFDRYLSTRPSRELLLRFAESLRHGAGHHGTLDPAAAAQLELDLDVLVAGLKPTALRWIPVTTTLSYWRFARELERRAWGGRARRKSVPASPPPIRSWLA